MPQEFPEERDLARERREAVMNEVYEACPDVGPLLRKALQEGTGEEAKQVLDQVNNAHDGVQEGTYELISFSNPVNGRKFDLKIFKRDMSKQKFNKSAKPFILSASYQTADFER